MLVALTAVAAAISLVLNGAMAGLFYAFSVAVMPGFDAIKGEHAIRAMQSIDRKILNPVFMLAFIGTPVFAAITAVLLLFLDQTEAALLSFASAAVYIVGVFMVTGVVNVPMNNALDTVTPPAAEGEASRVWSDYSGRWTAWNHVRTLTNLASMLLVGLSMLVWGGAD